MDCLSNSFSVLQLDAEDDTLQPLSSNAATVIEDTTKTGKKAEGGNSSSGMVPVKNEIHDQQNLVMTSEEYKLPLVWIDLEMTGLNVEMDRILEIACIITDGNLVKSVEGPNLVVHQTKECLDKMGEWCQNHHAASGLTNKVLRSTISEQEAETQKYMPDLASLFSHVVVDVSSIKALCIRWYPRDQKKAPSKENKHRAMDDIRESIMELKYYKQNIFKTSKSKR